MMTRFVVRRTALSSATAEPSLSVWPLVLGLGLGAAAGFLLGEVVGPVASRAVNRQRVRTAPAPKRVAALVRHAQAALDDDLLLRDCHLRVIAIGPGRIELHGWVVDRRSRARAAHLVSDAVRADEIINCLQVRGEDDLDDELDTNVDERLA